MAESIDAEILIYLIEMRPVLWDKTLDIFKDRILTRNAWREVCLELNPEFEALEDKAKNAFGKDVIKRWTNLRDAFAKSNKRIKESKTSGSGGKTPKKYVFNDQLQFLKKLGEDRVTVDSFGDDAGETSEDMAHNTEGDTGIIITAAINETINEAPCRARKRRKPDEVELKILKALEAEKPNSKLSFFHSLLPHLDKYDVNEMLEFQMGVLQVIANINKKKNNVVLCPPIPQLSAQFVSAYQPSRLPTNISQPHSFLSTNFSLSSGRAPQEGYARNISNPISPGSSTMDSVDFTSI